MSRRHTIRHIDVDPGCPISGTWKQTVFFASLQDGPDKGRPVAMSIEHTELAEFVAHLVAFAARQVGAHASGTVQDRIDAANAFVAKVTAQIENTVYRELHGASEEEDR